MTNKSKKIATVFAASAMAITTASAQPNLIGAWDFTNVLGSNADFTGDFDANGSGPASLGSGDMYWDGSNGSSAGIDFGGFFTQGTDMVTPNSANLSANTSLPVIGSLGAGSGIRFLPTAAGESFVIGFDSTGFADITLSYAARNSNDGISSINWEYSTNGVDFFNAGVVNASNTIGGEAPFTVDFVGVDSIENQGSVFFRGNLGSAAGVGNLDLDNFQVVSAADASTVVPEPSTYALMMAGIVGCVVYFRRRRA